MPDSHSPSPGLFENDLKESSSSTPANTNEPLNNEVTSMEEKPVTSEVASHSAAEQRQKRREELLERQNQARKTQITPTTSTAISPSLTVEAPEQNEPTTPVPTSSNSQTDENSEPVPRPQMIAQALSFLNSPNVQTAPLSKKIAFLKKKGLTQVEIDAAVEKASLKNTLTEPSAPDDIPKSNSNVSANVPPVPPRTYIQSNPTPQPVSILMAPNPNAERIRNMIVALMITSGLTAGLLGLFKLVMLPIRKSLTQEQHLRYEQQSKHLEKFHEQLVSYHRNLQSEGNTWQKSVEKCTQSLRRSLLNFETQLMVYREINQSRERSMDEVKTSFYDLTRSLGSTGYFSIYKLQAEHRSGLPAQIRSDIRSIKGLLLSRRTPFNSIFQQQTMA